MYMAQTKAVAQLLVGDRSGASQAMRDGMMQLPWLYAALFRTLQLDMPASIWGLQPPGDHAAWTGLYIHTAKEVWAGQPAAVALLKEVAAAIPRQTISEAAFQSGAATLNLGRTIFLMEEPSLLSQVPRQLLNTEPNFEFDPLPPREEDNIFSETSDTLRLAWRRLRPDNPRTSALLLRLEQQQQQQQQQLMPPNMAAVGDPGAEDRLWQQFLLQEGRRVVAQRRADGELGPGAEAEAEVEVDNDGGGEGVEETEEERETLRMFGLREWFRQLLEQREFMDQDGEGDGEDDEDEDENADVVTEGGEQHETVHGRGSTDRQPPAQRTQRTTMPGAWPGDGDGDGEDDDEDGLMMQ